jgi:hypothetical protein
MQPYVDTKTGELDAWPAHASGHSVPTTSMMMTKDKSLVLVSDEQMGKPNMIPKPRFLEQLENYLKKELRALDVVEVEPNELRLQVLKHFKDLTLFSLFIIYIFLPSIMLPIMSRTL